MARRASEVGRVVDDEDRAADPRGIAEAGGISGVIAPLAEPGSER